MMVQNRILALSVTTQTGNNIASILNAQRGDPCKEGECKMNRDQFDRKLKQHVGRVRQDIGKMAGIRSKTAPDQRMQRGQKTEHAQQVLQDQQAQQTQDSEGPSQQATVGSVNI